LAAIRMKRTAFLYNLTNAGIQRKTHVTHEFQNSSPVKITRFAPVPTTEGEGLTKFPCTIQHKL
jgi:hypothetical protein